MATEKTTGCRAVDYGDQVAGPHNVCGRHLADPSGGDGVVRLDDPVPPGPDVPTGQWWPPAMLSPAWVLDHHQEFDVFHVQFGFDAQDADRLGALVDALRAVRKPL